MVLAAGTGSAAEHRTLVENERSLPLIINKQFARTAWNVVLAASALAFAAPSHAALTWHWINQPADPNLTTTITNNMNAAVADFNTYANYTGDIPVNYNSGVPTAQTDSYRGWIEFGGSYSQRTCEHEMSHWLVNGTYSAWFNFNGTGRWAGASAQALEQLFDGPNAYLSCDSIHYWPYGANYDNEPWGFRHIAMCGALCADCGLGDVTIWPNPSGVYRLQNRESGLYLDGMGRTANGSIVAQYASSGSNNQKWRITALGGHFFKLQNVATGLYLDTGGNTANGSTIQQWGGGGSWNQQWSFTPVDSGYVNIVCRASAQVVDNYGSNSNGANMVNWGWWFGNDINQQWRLVQ